MAEERVGLKVQPEVTHLKQNVLGTHDLSYNCAQILHSTPLVTNILDYSPLSGTRKTFLVYLLVLGYGPHQDIKALINTMADEGQID